MPEPITLDSIIAFLREAIQDRRQLPPDTWLDAAAKINILLSDYIDALAEKEMEVAQARVKWIEMGTSNAEAESRVKASTLYRDLQIMKGRLEQYQEMSRLARERSRLKAFEASTAGFTP